MTKVMAIAMQKGGVGKTTTTINLAAALTELDYRVLVVDTDPQGNLTEHAGFDPETIKPSIYNLFKAEIENDPIDTLSAVYESAENFYLLPSQPELSLIELLLMNTLSRERVLTAILEPIKQYFDYILIDCNPSLGLLVVNALTASDTVLIPIQTEFLAARGANMLLSTIETIKRKGLNQSLEVAGIVLTMADTRTLMTREVLEAVKEQFGDTYHIFDTIVKRSVRFSESAVAGQSILAYQSRGAGAKAYRALARELIAHG